MREAREAKPITILHLSDVQFGKNQAFGLAVTPEGHNQYDSVRERVILDLRDLKKRYELAPNLVILTGDLADTGKKSEFDAVLDLIVGLENALSLTRDRIIVVPGNHDINHDACEAYFKTSSADDLLPDRPYIPKWRHYAQFFSQLYDGIPAYVFNEEQHWTFFEIEQLKVVIAGLNSTIAESHLDDDHYGWVGEPQCQWFENILRSYRDKEWLRIAVVHHNVVRGARNDNDNLKDSDTLRRILEDSLNCILHGHTHHANMDWWGPHLPIISTGSTAVAEQHRPPGVPNQYQVIEFLPDRIHRWGRAFAPERNDWTGDTRISKSGDAWDHEQPVAFQSVYATFSTESPFPLQPTPSDNNGARRTPYTYRPGITINATPTLPTEGVFGISEGAQEDLRRFLQLPGSDHGVRLDRNDLTTRIIAGRKGSGKTFYLRLLRDATSNNSAYCVIDQDDGLPDNANVKHFTNLFNDHERSDMWSTLWRRMIFRSLATYFFAEFSRPTALPTLISDTMTSSQFRDTFRHQMPSFGTPRSIFACIDDALSRHTTSRADIMRYLSDESWPSIERIVTDYLHKSPPIFIYLDALDDKCPLGPAAWLDFQKGLFYQVMALLNQRGLADRLHIIITVRDSTRANVLLGENATKYYSNPHIKILDWNPALAKAFFQLKVRDLPVELLAEPGEREYRPYRAWLGIDTITNPTRGVEEGIESYILRHTRHLPRDIVYMGNALCKRNRSLPAEEEIRSKVSGCARIIARESMRIAANNIVAAFPNPSVDDEVIFIWLKTVIEDVGKDVFSYDELMAVVGNHRLNIGGEQPRPSRYCMHEIQNALWQQGLIGYRQTFEGRTTDHFNRTGDEFNLPTDKEEYVLFPGVIDLCGVSPVGNKPVGELV